MALDQKAQYPVGTADPTAAYPEGSALNETVLDALDGFPWEKEGINDRFGFEQALLRTSEQAASGTPDTALVSQYLQGVIELAAGRATAYDDGGVADAYVMDLRTGQQFAAGLFIGLAVTFTPANGNAGASTLDYNGTIDALVDRAGIALTGAELTAGIEATAVWDGADWRLMTGAAVDLLTGTLTHEMTADADYTLTADENRSGRVVITDTVVTLTGAVNIVVANIKRLFFAQNDTAETLTFKTSAGTGVAIAAGKSTQLLCDGVNVLEAVQPAVGSVVQVVNVTDGAVNTGATAFPFDNTIPQNTEGNEFMSLAITPKAATNKLLVEVELTGACDNSPQMSMGLFRDAIANALAVSTIRPFALNNVNTLTLSFFLTAGAVTPTTFKVRAGGTAGTMTFNGSLGAGLFNGVLASSITITEIRA